MVMLDSNKIIHLKIIQVYIDKEVCNTIKIIKTKKECVDGTIFSHASLD